jgi:DNA-binding LacI/PurR family transcriptional regulator/DNA-binding transcriptional regulator YhcF (GntR family)
MSNSLPARVIKALSFLSSQIEKGRFKQGENLGSIDKLAQQAGVSRVTMWKALGKLNSLGIIEGSRGVPFSFVAHMPAKIDALLGSSELKRAEPAEEKSQRAWESLAGAIKQDIINGLYPPGTSLPSSKELQNTYGACFRTLKRALDYLAAQKAIVRRKRGYAVTALATARSKGSRIVLVGHGRGRKSGRISLDVGGEFFIRNLESDCARAGIRLETVTYYVRDNEIETMDESAEHTWRSIDNDAVLGYIFLKVVDEEAYVQVLARLAHFKKPVAIMTHDTDIKLPPSASSRYFTIFMSSGAHRPGEHVGRYLIELGHRHIAYISAYHKAQWSKNRLAGLRKAFESCGKDSACAHTVDDRATAIEYYRDSEKRSQFADAASEIRKSLSGLSVQGKERIMDIMNNTLRDERILSEVSARLTPLFKKALADSRTTAWVLSNDETALLAREFLKKKSVDIPAKLSLISFNDDVIAVRNRLSSYNFNISSLVHAMISFVLNRGHFRTSTHRRVVEIEGHVVARETTGMVRRK